MKTTAKHILIGGGSGFIGQAITKVLIARGDQVTLISRTPGPNRITWDEVSQSGLPRCDAVINLAGKHILDMSRFWTQRYKQEVITSRVATTDMLVNAINQHPQPPEVFVSTAGKCFYGSNKMAAPQDCQEVDEYCQPVGMDFPAELVQLWEAAADNISQNIRHVKLRIGIVLAKQETPSWPKLCKTRGILPLLRLPFSLGLGARLGSGKQPFPWVHITDVVNLTIRAIDNNKMQGLYNAVAPGIVSNQEFTQLFAKKLQRPVLGAIPSWLIKVVVGADRSSILLLGQRVKPKRTMQSGFVFDFPNLECALTELTNR